MVLLQGNGPDQPGVPRRAPMADPSRINWDLADWEWAVEKGVGVRGSAAGMGCVRVRVGSGFSLSFLVLRTTYVFRTFGSGFMCFFLFFCFFASDAWELCCREGD